MRPELFFSETYAQARNRFLEAAEDAGAVLAHHLNPHAKGPDGIHLFLDTAWFGPRDAATVMLNCCGTHGAEGYGGSAAQLAWMLDGGPRTLPEGVAVLLVHALNPFGFAWGLRGTENNVDLNRNFLDHSLPHPENPLYDRLHRLLSPRRINEGAIRELMREGARFVAEHGRWALEDAISRGQYTHPDGYHFGGLQPEWSNLMLTQILKQDLAHAARIGFIDWHSGPIGDGELIFLSFSNPRGPDFARACQWWGKENLSPEMVNAQWGSKRPTRRGILFWGIEETLKPRASLTGAVVEFCSARAKADSAASLRVPMLERWLRFEGGFNCPEAPGFLEEIREEYAPHRLSWYDAVITNSRDCYARALKGLGEWEKG